MLKRRLLKLVHRQFTERPLGPSRKSAGPACPVTALAPNTDEKQSIQIAMKQYWRMDNSRPSSAYLNGYKTLPINNKVPAAEEKWESEVTETKSLRMRGLR
jgi:hypothetical protein